MKEKITQLSRERFEYDLPKLVCSREKLEIEVETGKVAKGTFVLGNTAGRQMKGLLYSSSHLLELEMTSFVGEETEIGYEFHAEDIRAKDKITGQISVVSSCGEMELPFEITVLEKFIDSPFGEVRDLFQFANLARLNWPQAVSIFKTDAFKEIFLKKDIDVRNLYEGLVQSGKYNQALEEFLVYIQKKERMVLEVEQQSYSFDVKKENVTDQIVVKKNSWGFLDAKIYCDQPFVQISKQELTVSDFIGDGCLLDFEVDNSQLRIGKNVAYITIQTAFQTITVDVTVEKNVKHMELDYDEGKIKKCEVILVERYLDLRNNRISVADYVADMRDAITKLDRMLAVKRNLGELGYTRRLDLYRMHLYMVEGNKQKVQEMIDVLEREAHIMKRNTLVDYCGYMYLKALYSRREPDLQNALRELRECFKQEPNSWEILWMMMFLDEKFEQEPAEKIVAISEQYERGCRSPILYYEVCNIINQDPTLLKELTPCLLQVVNMGVKYILLSEPVAVQFAYLAEREKKYNQLVIKNLVYFYEKYKNKDVLSAICSIMIKADMSSIGCFEWYDTGVKEQLHLTQLYEYYMYSIDETYEGLLPQDVYLYFSYNTNLSDDKKAFLYANVVKHKKELTEIYPMFESQIRLYVQEQQQKGKINSHLAVLYREFISVNDISSSVAQTLPNILFKQRIHCTHPGITGVVVRHKESDEEIIVSLDEYGDAYVDIFTEHAKIFLLSSNGRRYVTSIPYEQEKLMTRNALAEVCFQKAPNNRMLCMYIYEKIEYYHKRNIKINDLQKYMDVDWLKPEYRKKWIMKLIQNYYDNYEGDALEALLQEIDLQGMRSSQRKLITEYCIIRGLYARAYEQICEYSFEGITVKRLRALCSKMIKQKGMEEEDQVLSNMAFYVFKSGKYDENILLYLVRFYLGTTRDMILVWREAREYDMDTIDLEERLLGQILFAESYVKDAMDVFLSFYGRGRNRTLIKAFVSYYSFKYVVKDRVLDPAFFEIVRKELEIEDNASALYALLKYYSTLDSWNDDQKEFIKEKVDVLMEKGIIFPFFKNFTKALKFHGGLEHMVFVEYRTLPERQVVLHYFVEDEEMGEGFNEIPLKNMYGGIYVQSFMLFQNETLQYYIEEIVEDEEPVITESITVKGAVQMDVEEEEEDLFAQINLMLMAREMKDEKTLLTALRHYAKNQYAFEHAFKMKE